MFQNSTIASTHHASSNQYASVFLALYRTCLVRALCCLAGLALASSPAWAATIYVATTGNDTTGDGTVGNPCATVQKGVTSANAGDTISVASGTYAGQVSIAKSITLQGAQAGVDARGGRPAAMEAPFYPWAHLESFPARTILRVDGFKIVNSGGTGNGLISATASANSFTLTNTIVSVTVNAATGSPVLFQSGTHTNMVFSFNLFQDRGDASLYFGGGAPTDVYDNLNITSNKFVGQSGGVFKATNNPFVKRQSFSLMNSTVPWVASRVSAIRF